MLGGLRVASEGPWRCVSLVCASVSWLAVWWLVGFGLDFGAARE